MKLAMSASAMAGQGCPFADSTWPKYDAKNVKEIKKSVAQKIAWANLHHTAVLDD
jgi:hypothetical protein